MKALVVVDMQNDFITGCLGTPEAEAIVPRVKEKIDNFDGLVVFTKDWHDEDKYSSSQEGRRLPVPHCIKNSNGARIDPRVYNEDNEYSSMIFNKTTFGCLEMIEPIRCGPVLTTMEVWSVEEIELIGVCTDICVISNAFLLKANFPEARIVIDASCCAGVTPESHKTALAAMKACQMDIIGEEI